MGSELDCHRRQAQNTSTDQEESGSASHPLLAYKFVHTAQYGKYLEGGGPFHHQKDGPSALELQKTIRKSQGTRIYMQTIHGLTPMEAQGTIYLAVEVDLQKFKDIKDDNDFVRLLRAEENLNLLPLSAMGDLCGIRLLTCGG